MCQSVVYTDHCRAFLTLFDLGRGIAGFKPGVKIDMVKLQSVIVSTSFAVTRFCIRKALHISNLYSNQHLPIQLSKLQYTAIISFRNLTIACTICHLHNSLMSKIQLLHVIMNCCIEYHNLGLYILFRNISYKISNCILSELIDINISPDSCLKRLESCPYFCCSGTLDFLEINISYAML